MIGGKMSGMSQNPGNLIGIIAAVIAAYLIFTVFFSPAPPIIEVVECSISPDTINVNSQAILTIKIRNHDEEQGHPFEVEFRSHNLVAFYLGEKQLQKDGDVWHFNDVLNPSAELTQPIIVRADLETGTKRLTRLISVRIYSNGEKLADKELELAVER